MSDKMQIRHIAIRSEDPGPARLVLRENLRLEGCQTRNPRGNKSSIYMTDGFMHVAINASKGDQPNGIWHFGFLVPSLDPINAITPVHQERARPAAMPKIISSILRAIASMSFSTCGRLKEHGL